MALSQSLELKKLFAELSGKEQDMQDDRTNVIEGVRMFTRFLAK